MRYIRFHKDNIRVAFGEVDNDDIVHVLDKDFLNEGKRTGEQLPLKGIKLLPPTEPSKIIAVGMNYLDHIKEMGENTPLDFPSIFVKLPHTVIGQHDAIIYPKLSQQVDYEAELALVIGENNIFGVTCLNDVTARDLQKKDTQWIRAKNFPSFCPLGPWITTDIDFNNLNILSKLNGKIMQNSNTSKMIFSPTDLVQLILTSIPLNRGDIIATGTPGGTGSMKIGDIIEIEIEQIGTLRNIIKKEDI